MRWRSARRPGGCRISTGGESEEVDAAPQLHEGGPGGLYGRCGRATVTWFGRDAGVRTGLELAICRFMRTKAGSAILYICQDAATAAAIRSQGLGPDLFLWVTDIDEAQPLGVGRQ